MSIVSCSLGCVGSANNPSVLVSCGNTDVFVNQAIRVTFSGPVDPLSVDNNTFRMTDRLGMTPPGTFEIDPDEPNVLVYRPQLTFDSAGNPIFGLNAGATYQLKIPGARANDDPPFIRNMIGQSNTSRLDCRLTASRGVFDATPGQPRITTTVDIVTGYDANNNPISFAFDQPAHGATNVFRGTEIQMVFDDIMNPATLVNRVNGLSEFIFVSIDPDGNTVDDDDQVPLAGVFTIALDQNALRTTVVFHPSGNLPSAGNNIDPNDPNVSRKIVIKLSPQIVDLGGNRLANGNDIIFTSEKLVFETRDLVEAFDTNGSEDKVRTGNSWGAGRLAKGPGGGSGRLGDLIVLPNRVVELDTDLENFQGIEDPAMFNPANVIDRGATLEVVGGVFEFSRLRIDAGGVLRLKGSKPARLYVRGEVVIQGLLDVAGASSPLHEAIDLAGGTGGQPGPGGGSGGTGGMRPDGSNFIMEFGVPNEEAGPEDVLNPATYDRVNGQNGGGIPIPNTLDPSPDFVGFGEGGIAWPQPSPANFALHMPATPTDFSGLQFEKLQECRTITPAAPGGGGAYALPGGDGIPLFGGILSSPVTEAPPAPGGSNDLLGINDTIRTLSPELGFLRGGAGGGGGGAHLQQTQINGIQLFDCFSPIPAGSPSKIIAYVAHSSAGGGGGGGGLQIAAGRRIILNGLINASGGDGGSGTFPPPPENPEDFAQAGGGGAGGAVLLQSQVLQLQPVPGRLNVAGGVGGEGTGLPFPVTPSEGGDGSPGFLRLEANVAPSIAAEASKITPRESDLQAQYGPTVEIEDIISTAVWTPVDDAPSGMSGAQSCWLRPSGDFFQLKFEPDTAEPGWDLSLRIDGQAALQSYRGTNDLFPQTLEEVFGNELGSAPLVVRFQGARALGTLIDPCAVVETGLSSPLQENSLTDWVQHPAELSDFHGDPGLTPNIFRFVVMWDKEQPFFDQIVSIEEVRVRVTPD